MRRLRTRWISLVIVLMAGVPLALWMTREPRAEGRTLTQWLEVYQSGLAVGVVAGSGNDAAAREAVEAVRRMGPAGLRHLLRIMRTEDSRLKITLANWACRLHLARSPTQIYSPAEAQERRALAAGMLSDLDADAAPALPALLEWVLAPDRGVPTGARNLPDQTVVGLGRFAVPSLVWVLTNGSPQAQAKAVSLLTSMGREAAAATPLLLPRLDSSNRLVRAQVIRALGEIGMPGSGVEARLAELLPRPNDDARDAACALAALGSSGTITLVLVATNSDPHVCWRVADGLKWRRELLTRRSQSRSYNIFSVRSTGGWRNRFFNLKDRDAAAESANPAGPGFVPAGVMGSAERDMNYRDAAMSSISATATTSVATVLLALIMTLDDPDPAVREAARTALHQLRMTYP